MNVLINLLDQLCCGHCHELPWEVKKMLCFKTYWRFLSRNPIMLSC